METIIVNVDTKKETQFFIQLVKKIGYTSRILSEEEKEDIGLLRMMQKRKDEKNIPIQTTYKKLDNIIKQKTL